MNEIVEVPLVEISRPKQWPTISRRELTETGFPVYGANGKIGFSDTYTHADPTVIIGCRGSCGQIHVTVPNSYVTGNAMALDALDTDRVDQSYLVHFLRKRGFDDIVSGSSQPQITRKGLSRLFVPLPSIQEQRRIAAILDKADAIRRKREQVLDLADEFLKSVFLEMFGDPLVNPKNWPVRPMSTHLEELRYGTSTKCSDTETKGSTPVLRIPNVIGESVNWANLKFGSLPEKEVQRLSLCSGDILFVRTNGNPDYIGRCAVFEDNRNAVFASYLIRARITEDAAVSPKFLAACLSMPSYRSCIVKVATTTAGNYNINTKGLGGLPIIEPPEDLQLQYVRTTEAQRSHVMRLEMALSEDQQLFGSLSQRAFHGEL